MMTISLKDPRQSCSLLFGSSLANTSMKLVYSCTLWYYRKDPWVTFFLSCFWKANLVHTIHKWCSPMTKHRHFHCTPSPESIMGTCTMVFLLSSRLPMFSCWNFFRGPNLQFLMCNHGWWKYWLVLNLCAWFVFRACETKRLRFISCNAKWLTLQKLLNRLHVSG